MKQILTIVLKIYLIASVGAILVHLVIALMK